MPGNYTWLTFAMWSHDLDYKIHACSFFGCNAKYKKLWNKTCSCGTYLRYVKKTGVMYSPTVFGKWQIFWYLQVCVYLMHRITISQHLFSTVFIQSLISFCITNSVVIWHPKFCEHWKQSFLARWYPRSPKNWLKRTISKIFTSI